MLCAQLVQSLYLRPKRGRPFYYMIAYGAFVFAVATMAVTGRFLSAEQQFIDNRMSLEGPTNWFWNHSDSWKSIMTFARCVFTALICLVDFISPPIAPLLSPTLLTC